MMRLAGGFRLAALIASGPLLVVPALLAAGSWVEISIDPLRDVVVGWAEGDYTEDEATFENPERAAFVLTNRSAVAQAAPELTIALSDPSQYEMVTLTAISGRTTHMTSVRNPSASDVVSFDPGLRLASGESLAVDVEATPAGSG